MSLKMKVKVGAITHLSDARYCAGMGVDLLGFPVGVGGLAPSTYRQLIEWVSGPEYVLELTDDASLEEVKQNYPGHYIQISSSALELLKDETVRFIVTVHAAEWATIKSSLVASRTIFALEVKGVAGYAAVITDMAIHFPVFVAMDGSVQADELLAWGATGIALQGGEEEKPGIRDYSSLADVLEKLEID